MAAPAPAASGGGGGGGTPQKCPSLPLPKGHHICRLSWRKKNRSNKKKHVHAFMHGFCMQDKDQSLPRTFFLSERLLFSSSLDRFAFFPSSSTFLSSIRFVPPLPPHKQRARVSGGGKSLFLSRGLPGRITCDILPYKKLQFRFFFLKVRMPERPPPPEPLRLLLLAAAPPLDGLDDAAAMAASRLRRSLATTMSIAWSKISSTPCISLLLHSIYWAPIFLATVMPWSVVTGVSPCVFSISMHVFLCRRSDLRPTRIRGVYGQK